MEWIKVSANNIFQTFRNFNYDNLQADNSLLGNFKLKENYYEDIKISLKNSYSKFDNNLMFSRMEQIILIICFDYYIKNFDELDENGFLEITLSTIHEKYRKMCKKITDKTLKAYEKAFENLANKTIEISFDNFFCKNTYIEKTGLYKINQSIITFKKIENNNRLIGFKFSFGKLGVLLNFSKQIFSIPADFLKVKRNGIDGLNLAITIGYLIFLNKKNKEFYCSFSKLLKRIPFYLSNKELSFKNYFQELQERNKKFYKELQHIIYLTERVLKTYKEKGIIKDYTIPRITAKNFDDFDMKIKVKNKN